MMTTNTKSKAVKNVTLKMSPIIRKDGVVVHIYNRTKANSGKQTHLKVAEITTDHQLELSKGISIEEEATASFLYQNLMAISRNGSLVAKDRITFYLPEDWEELYVEAYTAAKKAGVEFNPAKRMYEALMSEISLVKAENNFKKKHIDERVVFDELVGLGPQMFTSFAKIAKERYGQSKLVTTSASLKHYQHGGGKPRAWEFAVALEVIASYNKSIFDLGLSLEQVVKLWVDGNKAKHNAEEMTETFIELFNPGDHVKVEKSIQDIYNQFQALQQKFNSK